MLSLSVSEDCLYCRIELASCWFTRQVWFVSTHDSRFVLNFTSFCLHLNLLSEQLLITIICLIIVCFDKARWEPFWSLCVYQLTAYSRLILYTRLFAGLQLADRSHVFGDCVWTGGRGLFFRWCIYLLSCKRASSLLVHTILCYPC